MIALVLVAFGATGYITYFKSTTEVIKTTFNPQPSPLVSPSPELTQRRNQTAAEESCSQFATRFGVSAEELISYINGQPEAAVVMQGYRLVYGQVLSILPGNNFPFVINLDNGAKITSISCTEPTAERDYSQDFDFTIPESDFAQIVRYRETLEASQAATYLQNMITTPPEAKQIILEQIEAL